MECNPMILTDFYKTIHHRCYPEGLTKLYSYWTPRMSRKEGIDKVVMFGLQAFIEKYLVDYFEKEFFSQSLSHIIRKYETIILRTMGAEYADTKHIEKLHRLGYLPIEIKALPEGSLVDIKVPMIQITNTHDDFAWLVNYIETLMSCNIWQPMTSATIAHNFRVLANEFYEKTVDDENTPPEKACGDFSMRGMSSVESAQTSSAGHLLSFTGTATIPAIDFLERYYNRGAAFDNIGTGIPSTEHSIMCSYGEDELKCYKTLINKKFPTGPLSIVSDTYDYWNLLTNILPQLKDDILNRDGKIIIRGDSGDPIKIICGDPNAEEGSPEHKGTVEILWDIFGGKVNSKGYKVLDPHIGAIYGDSITLERCKAIFEGLEKKGFAVSNCILGIGLIDGSSIQ